MILKNNSITKKSFLLAAFIAFGISSFAFNYKLTLLEKSFEDESFNFFIQKVVDARLNKEKPIGALVEGFSLNKETVGNDSLGYQMTALFNRKPEIFNASLKVIMVINQLNLRLMKSADGKKEELEFSIAIDYYQSGEKSCGLLYQQFFKFKQPVKSATKIAKDIDKGFTETIKKALVDFKKQIKKNKAIVRKEFETGLLFQFLENKPAQVVNSQNVQDGLYFSCKDLYFNNPGVVSNYSFTDSAGLGQRPLIVRVPGYLMERVYAIVRGRRIFIYAGRGNYKEAVFGDDGKLFIPSIVNVPLSVSEKGSSTSIGILNTLPPATKAISATADSTAKQPQTIYKATDFYLDLETGDLVSLVP
jgi:hypothetical protein